MRSCNAPGRAAQTQAIAGNDVLSLMHIDATEVHRKRVQPQPVIDHHAVALVVERPREYDYSAVRRANHRSRRSAKIHSLVNAGQLAVEHPTRAKAICG